MNELWKENFVVGMVLFLWFVFCFAFFLNIGIEYPLFFATAFSILVVVLNVAINQIVTRSNERKALEVLKTVVCWELANNYAVATERPGDLLSTVAWESLVNSGLMHYLSSNKLTLLTFVYAVIGFRNYELSRGVVSSSEFAKDKQTRTKWANKETRIRDVVGYALSVLFALDTNNLDTKKIVENYYNPKRWTRPCS